MTDRKNPEIDMRTGISRKRSRRTPEELERARKNGENIRDQRGGERRRSLKIDGVRMSAEDRGIDKRFSSDKIKRIQLKSDLERAIELRHTLGERKDESERQLHLEAKRNNNKVSQSSSSKLDSLQAEYRRQLEKERRLSAELSVVESRLKSK
jgi:hypothetical protein